MIKSIDQITKPVKREINLTGPDGNAFTLMGYASKLAKQLDLDDKAILDDMKSGDYEHLLEVFDDSFGDCVDIFR